MEPKYLHSAIIKCQHRVSAVTNRNTGVSRTYMPAPPIPQMARPTFRASMLGAAPARAQPTEKTTKLAQKVHLALNLAYMSPQKKLVPQHAARKATPSHASLSRDSNCRMTAGWMLAAMVLSVANKKLAMRMLETTSNQTSPWAVRGGEDAGASFSFSLLGSSVLATGSTTPFSASELSGGVGVVADPQSVAGFFSVSASVDELVVVILMVDRALMIGQVKASSSVAES